MKAWVDLVDAATIGIDPGTALPDALWAAGPPLSQPLRSLADRLERKPAAALAALAAAAVLHAAHRGGLGPGGAPVDPQLPWRASPYPPAPAREDPPTNELSRRVAERIVQLPPAVATELASQASRAGFAVPAACLAVWLAAASQDADFAQACSPLLGARGVWLAEMNPAWRTAAMAPASALGAALDDLPSPCGPGSPAPPALRARWFRAARSAEPAAARERLAARWTGLTPPVRAALLEQLRQGLGPADEPFLNGALTDRSGPVRQVAARLLSALPGSAHQSELARRVATLIEVGIAPGRLRVRAPADEPTDFTQLTDLVALAPLQTWTALTALTPSQLLTVQVRPPEAAHAIARGWQAATLTQRDPVWAAALLAMCPMTDHRKAAELIKVLSATGADPMTTGVVDRYAGLPTSRLAGHCLDGWPADELDCWPWPWPRSITDHAFRHLQARMRTGPPDPGDHRVAQLTALRAAPDSLRPAPDWLADLLALTPSHSRWRPVLVVAADLAALRHSFDQEPP